MNNEELAYGLRSISCRSIAPSSMSRRSSNLAVHRSMVSMDDLIERYGADRQADSGRDFSADRTWGPAQHV